MMTVCTGNAQGDVSSCWPERRSFAKQPVGLFLLTLLLFLVLPRSGICEENDNELAPPSFLWDLPLCIIDSHTSESSVLIDGSFPNCSESAQTLPPFPRGEVFESSRTTPKADEPLIEVTRSNSSTPAGEGRGPDVQWKSLMYQSSIYLGIMHGFRLATEGGTQKAMGNQPFGYFASLGSMHGWSDGDGYYENYLGHPLEGAVADYLWIHNDHRYRNVQFGKSRDYWMSRLRAYGYSWAFSEQFEIGLFSEASLGQVQRYCCAYGFVDHVITPNAGMIWLIGGDIIDRYITVPLETRTRSVIARSLLRAALNPPQSFANILTLQYPWHRENRPSPTEFDGQLYVHPETDSVNFIHPIVPKFELAAAIPSATQMGHHSCLGGSGVAGFRINDHWQWSMEVGGCDLAPSLPKHWGGDSLIFNSGPQWILHNSGRWSPHAHFRIGGQKITQDYCTANYTKIEGLMDGKPCTSEPNGRSKHYESTGFSISMGGGVDVKLNKALAFRVGNFDYMYSWLHPVAGTDYNQGLRFTTGLVLRIGTW
jgi:hypothetical protein